MRLGSLKRMSIVSVFTVVCLILTACSAPEPPAVKTKESLTLLHYFSGEFSGGIDALVGGFSQEQESYVLNAIPIDHEAFKTSILTALEEKNPPELYSYWAGARTESIAAQLQPIDEIWNTAGLDKVFPQSLVEKASRIDGKLYLLPITQHYVAFFYNKDVFKKYNLEPPKDWDAFLNVCETLKSNGVTPIGLGSKNRWPAQFWFDYLMLRSYPIEVRDGLMAGTIDYTSPEVQSVFEIWKTIIQKGYFNENPNNDDWHETPLKGLASGEVAMTLMGTWAVSALETDFNLIPDEDFGYFDFPTIDKSLPFVALGPVDGIIVPKESMNLEGAMAAIEYMARPESQKAMALGSGALSPSMQVSPEIYGTLQRQMLPVIQNATHWAFNYDLATSPERAELGLQLFSDFLVFPDAYKELLDKIQKELDKQ